MKTKRCIKCLKDKPLSAFYGESHCADNLRPDCKLCNNVKTRNFLKQQHILYPWKRYFIGIKQRCNNSTNTAYKYYGGRGIKCLITEEELKELWFRDKAYNLKRPSIDRENNSGHYEFSNCRFIELVENIAKDSSVSISQYDLDGNFIRTWNSAHDVTRAIHIQQQNISKVLTGKRSTAGGYKWKYAPIGANNETT